ncbi:MAG: hypothetical protein F4Y45_04340 [Acidobacteria bacterium]|nr:hypothetical protein [Acidobacteriota bacterium]MYJ05996.1 hypothetical protein [Acidobacteriota bacterium]
MWRLAIALPLLLWLPGFLLYRLPRGNRALRAALPAEERVFWTVGLSAAVTSIAALALAAAGAYSLNRVLLVSLGLCILLAIKARGNLRLGPEAAPVTRTAAAPAVLLLLAAGIFFYVPPAEYINGGRDPGLYIAEGIQLSRSGSFFSVDPLVRDLPSEFRDAFFIPVRRIYVSYDLRFLGYNIADMDRGMVVGQFPHFYPVWIAMAYELNGLTGARYVHGLWAIGGILAVYFLGAALFGRRAGFAAAGLLTLNVAQVWFARYFISEPFLQCLVFAALLAFIRSQDNQHRFFAPVAGTLLGLTIFVHLSSAVAMAALAAAAIAGRLLGDRLRASFLLPLFATGALAAAYYLAVLPHYALAAPVRTAAGRQPLLLMFVTIIGLAAGMLLVRSAGPRLARLMDRWLPPATLGLLVTLGIYAFFFRESRSLWTQPPFEREGIITFTLYYLQPLGLVAALAGWAVVSGARFRRAMPFLAVAGAYALFYFYDARITPDHFWAGRRYMPVLLPAALLLASAAVFMPLDAGARRWMTWCATPRATAVRAAAGGLVLAVLAVQYGAATRPILRHTEHAGMIPAVESLARRIGPDDLLLMSSRNASDAQTFALPLAYIYARNVLPLRFNDPDPKEFSAFLDWARPRYDRILFMGSGGTNLLTRQITPKRISTDRFSVPFYDRTLNAYPQGVDSWEFDFGLYELLPEPVAPGPVEIDVGSGFDLYVGNMHGKGTSSEGRSFRWTRGTSTVRIVGTHPEASELVLTLSGRLEQAGIAPVQIVLNDHLLATLSPGDGYERYTLPIPPDVAREMAERDEASELRIETQPWVPSRLLGLPDDRTLGIRLDRVVIH